MRAAGEGGRGYNVSKPTYIQNLSHCSCDFASPDCLMLTCLSGPQISRLTKSYPSPHRPRHQERLSLRHLCPAQKPPGKNQTRQTPKAFWILLPFQQCQLAKEQWAPYNRPGAQFLTWRHSTAQHQVPEQSSKLQGTLCRDTLVVLHTSLEWQVSREYASACFSHSRKCVAFVWLEFLSLHI